MDNIIDGIFGLFGQDTAAEREEKRLAPTFKCTANASYRPTSSCSDQPKMSDTRSNDELTMTTMSDDGGIISSTNIETQTSRSTQRVHRRLGNVEWRKRSTMTGSVTGGCPLVVRVISAERYCQSVAPHFLPNFNVRF